jgi:hypothetical protein
VQPTELPNDHRWKKLMSFTTKQIILENANINQRTIFNLPHYDFHNALRLYEEDHPV